MIFHASGQQIAVNTPSREALLRAVAAKFEAGTGFALATINLDHLVKLRRDAAFAEAYAAHDIIVADGNPVVWLSKLAKRPVALVPGSEMVLPLAQLASEKGVGVALLGSTQESLDAAAGALQAKLPALSIIAKIAPPMGFDPMSNDAKAMLEEIAASGAGLVFLALGAPKQERLAARGREITPSLGFASIGAGLDFLSGRQTRAPRWVQAIAMEWLWRALQAPLRLGPRYAKCIAILPALTAQALKSRRQS